MPKHIRNGVKKTHEQFVAEMIAKFGPDTKVLGHYVNGTTPIKIQHKCGAVYENRPINILRSRKAACPKCVIKRPSKTDAQFKKEVRNLAGDEYTFLDPYKTARTNIRCRHNKCGTVWMTRPNRFLNGHRCPNPSCIPNKPMKSREKLDEEVSQASNGRIVMIGSYKGMLVKTKFRHLDCNYEWEARPQDVVRGHGRPKCTNHISWDTNMFKDYLAKTAGDEYELLDEFKTMVTSIRLRHKKCGHVWETRPADFKKGHRCRFCADKAAGIAQRTSEEDFRQMVKIILGDEYDAWGYVRRKDRVTAKHKTCGLIWHPKAGDLLNGCGCPWCNQSRGERAAGNWLRKSQISYVAQKRFADCKDERPLPFDFYLPAYNLIIEYDGRQHFHKNDDYFGGEEAYKVRHKHDLIKDKYCKDHGINLLRIPYTITGDAIGQTIHNKLNELEGKPVKPRKHIEQLSLNIAM